MSTSPQAVQDVLVTDFRLTFVWVEPIFPVVTGATKPSAGFDFLLSEASYSLRFNPALQSSGTDLDIPWHGESKQFFWKFYLGGGGLEQTSAMHAWSHFVPLKGRLPFVARNGNFKAVSLEAFFYRHALGLMITCRFCGQLALTDAVKLAHGVKKGSEKFTVQQNGVPGPAPMDMESLAKTILSHMRESALGKTAQPGGTRDTFTLFTVVSAEPFIAFQPNGPIHRALHTVTEWPPDPATSQLLPATQIAIPIKSATAEGSILVGRQRARAVWFPGLFSMKDKRKPSLGCYHRNQCFSAMQVESLCAFVRGTMDLVEAGTSFYKLKSPHKASAMDAKERLEELYIANSQTLNTYRSSTARVQIEQNDLKRLNDLRRIINPACQDLAPAPIAPAAPPPKPSTTSPAAPPAAPDSPKA
jgi:hypothetical protein